MKDKEVARGKQPAASAAGASGSSARKPAPQKSGRLPRVAEEQPRTSTRDNKDTAAKQASVDAGSQDSMDIFDASPTGAKGMQPSPNPHPTPMFIPAVCCWIGRTVRNWRVKFCSSAP